MGARGHLRGALTAAVACAGCLDFVEPTLPAIGAPAVLQADVRVTERTIRVTARLDPGFDDEGFRRSVPGAALTLNSRAWLPSDTLPDGTLAYEAMDSVPSGVTQGPFLFSGPIVAGVVAPAPMLVWAGLTRLDPDTVRAAPASDLVLRVRTSGGAMGLALRQWLLTVSTDSARSVLGGNGAPPDSIVFPARYLPAGDTLDVRLTWSLSARLDPPPGDYIATVAADSRVDWTVIVDNAAASRR